MNLPNISFGFIADLLTVLSVIASFAAWIYSFRIWEKWQTGEQKVEIVLKFGNVRSYTLPYKIRRKNLSRAEIQGAIRLIERTKEYEKGYQLEDCLNKPEFFEQIDELQTRRKYKQLIIECDESKLEQFILP